MAKKEKPACEQAGHFNILGRVVGATPNKPTRSGGMLKTVCIEALDGSSAEFFSIENDYARTMTRGNLVEVSYHWNKRDENVVDRMRVIDSDEALAFHERAELEDWIGDDYEPATRKASSL